MSFKTTEGFWNGLGVGIACLCILIGFGQCEKGISHQATTIGVEKEKTKQLEVQLKIEQTKHATEDKPISKVVPVNEVIKDEQEIRTKN